MLSSVFDLATEQVDYNCAFLHVKTDDKDSNNVIYVFMSMVFDNKERVAN